MVFLKQDAQDTIFQVKLNLPPPNCKRLWAQTRSARNSQASIKTFIHVGETKYVFLPT